MKGGIVMRRNPHREYEEYRNCVRAPIPETKDNNIGCCCGVAITAIIMLLVFIFMHIIWKKERFYEKNIDILYKAISKDSWSLA